MKFIVPLFTISVGVEALWKTQWFQQPIDHSWNVGSFQQRYLVDDDLKAHHHEGPILFFCGNEGDIEVFANFSGFLREAAVALRARVVFAEHRFYGQSLPFGPDFNAYQAQYLTVEQALEDYAQLIQFLVPAPQRVHRPVVVFGGSYGGMLSSWMRAKYPDLVFAAVASSSPLHFDGVKAFFQLVTDAADAVSDGCSARVRRGFAAVLKQSRQRVGEAFGLCNDNFLLDELILWARNAFVTVSMGNYPYAMDLFGKGLSAWPLKTACEWSNASDDLEFLAKAVGSYYNATGLVACHSIRNEYRDCADQTGCGTRQSAWGRSWDIEACRQIVYTTSTNNVTDMFPVREWGPEELSKYCKQTWNITPEITWFQPWLSKIKNSSRIIFTNGLWDPWRSGGVLRSLSKTLVSFKIPEAGHMYDLAASHPKDLPAVRMVRQKVLSLLQSWLSSSSRAIVV
eukprot:symbB.v1.2.019631.t1/scaffold1616.1/size109294/7